MRKPEIIKISDTLIPEGSMAVDAAEVILGNGEQEVIELFADLRGASIDFRGLPRHLSDVRIDISDVQADDNDGNLKRALFKFAIGARQHLPLGAEVHYDDESDDPTSRHYRPFKN